MRARPGDVLPLAQRLREHPRFGPCFERWHAIPARAARTAAFPAGIDARLVELCQSRGIDELYEHQSRAIAAAVAGRDVLVATPTASGKTLCYTVPILQALLASKGASRSLLLFPTKALSQDQSAALSAQVESLREPWHAFTYDGDTPTPLRRTLRDRGHLVLTNPWMLHAGILPNHAKWSELFRDLAYVVVDEVHTLGGVFGSSVANVLRRLVRIARHYGSDPRFLLCSATLAEPAAHARRLLDREVEVVQDDGSPSGERIFGVYNPPMVNAVAGLRANALEEARELASVVCGRDHQTIFFCRRRTAVEVLTRYLKEGASRMGLRAEEIRGYRGGYLPDLRREIESGLRSGAVKVVVSTNALELGVDIGALDVAVLVGYPGSQASFWQRAGRVGRRGNPSLVVQIARSEPVDQYLARHPDWLFGAPRERIGLDPQNLVILSEHLKCAAFELPFRRTSGATSGAPSFATGELDDPSYGAIAEAAPVLDHLAESSHFLQRRGDTWFWMADAYPAQDVSLDGEEPDNVLVLDADTGKAIGEIDRFASLTSVHQGAIYHVEGETWIVERFDHKNRRAYARKVETDYFTEAEVDTEVRVLRLEERRSRPRVEPRAEHGVCGAADPGPDPVRETRHGSTPDVEPDDLEDASIWRGEVHVTSVATQYKKIRYYTRENVGAEDIHLPPEEKDTEAFVLTISDATAADVLAEAGDRGAAWHGLARLLRRVAPLELRCQPRDLGVSAHVRSPHFRRPAIFLYDAVRGGVGLSELLFRRHRPLFAAALDVVRHCACERGCPACVGPPEEVGALGKDTVRAVLEHLSSGAEMTAAPIEEEVAVR